MYRTVRSGLTIATAVSAIAIASACNRAPESDKTAAAKSTNANERPGITLVGCVQETKGIMGDYLLTAANRVERSVGTSGSTAGGDVVGREQYAAAAKSYRLDGDSDQLRDLIGKQVRVAGHVTDQADLAKPGTTADNKPPQTAPDRDISAGDLARVKIDSITKVADSCGAGSVK